MWNRIARYRYVDAKTFFTILAALLVVAIPIPEASASTATGSTGNGKRVNVLTPAILVLTVFFMLLGLFSYPVAKIVLLALNLSAAVGLCFLALHTLNRASPIPWLLVAITLGVTPILANQLAPTHIWIYSTTDDRTWPHNGHLDGKIIQIARLRPRQHLDLGPTFDLEQTDRISVANLVVHGSFVVGNGAYIQLFATTIPDQLQALLRQR